MALTSKQRHELHQAIAHYLSANGFDAAHNEFVNKLGDLGEDITASNGCADSTILEKKWTAVVRLQKRVIELEAQVKQLQADVKDVGAGQPRQAGERRNLPRGPYLHQLAGHRSAISRVVFHPVTSAAFSAGIPNRSELHNS